MPLGCFKVSECNCWGSHHHGPHTRPAASQDLSLTMTCLGSCSHTTSIQATEEILTSFLPPRFGCKVSGPRAGSHRAHTESKRAARHCLTHTSPARTTQEGLLPNSSVPLGEESPSAPPLRSSPCPVPRTQQERAFLLTLMALFPRKAPPTRVGGKGGRDMQRRAQRHDTGYMGMPWETP